MGEEWSRVITKGLSEISLPSVFVWRIGSTWRNELTLLFITRLFSWHHSTGRSTWMQHLPFCLHLYCDWISIKPSRWSELVELVTVYCPAGCFNLGVSVTKQKLKATFWLKCLPVLTFQRRNGAGCWLDDEKQILLSAWGSCWNSSWPWSLLLILSVIHFSLHCPLTPSSQGRYCICPPWALFWWRTFLSPRAWFIQVWFGLYLWSDLRIFSLFSLARS